ncbi:sensor domain-containing diguanylate cyclase [Sulfurimonas paralvinellae]|uniref:diguanylate cyclase n=1 Tax=Sulfurimonas paralvinellae TaxID=317658 RepID=A0A7M1BAD8_9BACT|nr:GGDEF domain-containing protein [Sulfurimonas paralvinellae]QOP46591.1 GGDEF domain-containing protein [Sulfurimonas paralvinellae]
MTIHNLKYTTQKALEKFIRKNLIEKSANVFVQIFSGICEPEKFMEVARHIKRVLPQAEIIGATTSGEICEGAMYDGEIVVSFSLFEHTSVKSGLYEVEKIFPIENIKNELYDKDTKAIIALSDGLKSNAEDYIKELHNIDEEVVIAGGRAGDKAQIKTYVFNEKEYTDNGLVLASLSAKELYVNSSYLLNWTPIGKEMIVTKCDGNILYELDGIPVTQVYRKYLGDDIIEGMPTSCMYFPLILEKEGVEVARDPLAVVQEDAMLYGGNFEEGDIVRFSFANIEDLTDNLEEYFQSLSQYPSEAVYIYSCLARKSLLQEKLLDELNLLESLAPAVGFFTYGEFYQSNKVAELLNVTTTFMMISESNKSEKKVFKESKTAEYDTIKKALTHLVKETTEELEHLSTHDTLTGLYNRHEYLKVIRNKIKSAERYEEGFGVILADIDHFKLVNDNYGHKMGDKVLIKFAEVLKKNIREDDFVSRWGGEEFIIIANYADINALEKITKKLQKAIAKIQVGPIKRLSASFGLTVYNEGDTDETLFKRVDNAMYVAKQNGRDNYVIG